MLSHPSARRSRGTSLIEVLITLIILAIGLLGVAALQSKMGTSEIESYQREQALLALSDMMNRIQANSSQAASYVTASPLGTNDGLYSPATGCGGYAVGQPLDLCQWSLLLQGAAEQNGTANTGAMVGARGCITQLQAPNPAQGVCTAGLYQVAVAWQGMSKEPPPTPACGSGDYGSAGTGLSYRRVVAGIVSIPTTSCY